MVSPKIKTNTNICAHSDSLICQIFLTSSPLVRYVTGSEQHQTRSVGGIPAQTLTRLPEGAGLAGTTSFGLFWGKRVDASRPITAVALLPQRRRNRRPAVDEVGSFEFSLWNSGTLQP